MGHYHGNSRARKAEGFVIHKIIPTHEGKIELVTAMVIINPDIAFP